MGESTEVEAHFPRANGATSYLEQLASARDDFAGSVEMTGLTFDGDIERGDLPCTIKYHLHGEQADVVRFLERFTSSGMQDIVGQIKEHTA